MTWIRDEMHALVDNVQEVREADAPRLAIVFIHGIYSSAKTFEPMFVAMRDSREMTRRLVEFWYYDYDFHNSIEDNGGTFAQLLSRHFTDRDKVVIVDMTQC